ncbi:MAG TPA: amidase family protein [Novosphingobium sp.]|nr:amidase family protein [Novosphingobium sp.]
MYPRLTDEPGAAETIAAISSGALSLIEATEAAIARIETRDGALNAVVVRDFDRARAAAKALQDAGPREGQRLYGLPMTVKESFDVAGLPTCWGIEDHAAHIATQDAMVVQRLKAHGAVILGKTNVPPSLADWQAANPVYGRTNNPHDPARSPGGSSGGSAAALASGMVAAEYGSDIGGSVRIPSHFSGVWGHKTTWGVVSSKGQEFPGSDGAEIPLGVVGPLARSAEDLALLLEVTLNEPLPRAPKPVREARFLYLERHPLCPVDPAVQSPIEAAVAAISASGAQVDRSSPLLPDLAALHADYMRMLGIVMSRGAPGPDGQVASAAQWFDLLDRQHHAQRSWAALFEHYDFVLMPPAALPAFAHDDRPMTERIWEIADQGCGPEAVLAYAGIAIFAELPATVLPIGAAGHLPTGLQVIGPRRGDRDCVAMAGAIGALVHG